MHRFDDIRSYQDHEVPKIVARLVNDSDFIHMIAQYRLPRLSRYCPPLINAIIAYKLKQIGKTIRTVADFQQQVEPYVNRVIQRSTSTITFSGLEHIDPNKSYLFVSNHRDIVMDPALINYALHINNRHTAHIAIGDNLLNKPVVADLMRLNKSFIVKRSVTDRRQKLLELDKLSAYIHHCLNNQQSVWIAQAEGRAKDGNDRTDTAMIKMLCMSQRKLADFDRIIQQLRIVPVALSYEFDPCDRLKARELHARAHHGTYDKAQGEDTASIVKGIKGYKGHVHVAFGTPLEGHFNDANAVAQAIDAQILNNYQIQPINQLAYQRLQASSDAASPPTDAHTRRIFNARLRRCTPAFRPYWLQMYAQPILNQQEDSNTQSKKL